MPGGAFGRRRVRARHDAGDQRHHRAQGRQDGAGHHRGLPRYRSRWRTRTASSSTTSSSRSPSRWCRAPCASPCPSAWTCSGNVRLALDEAAVRALAGKLKADGIEAIAIGFLHSLSPIRHARAAHARDPGGRAARRAISLSCEVSPEVREYERFSTAVRQRLCPAADGALPRAPARRRCVAEGFACPLYLMTSGGGLTALETARALPDPPRRIGPGRRRDPCSALVAAARPSSSVLLASTWAAPPPRSA